MQVRRTSGRGKEEDGEGQVEVERRGRRESKTTAHVTWREM